MTVRAVYVELPASCSSGFLTRLCEAGFVRAMAPEDAVCAVLFDRPVVHCNHWTHVVFVSCVQEEELESTNETIWAMVVHDPKDNYKKSPRGYKNLTTLLHSDGHAIPAGPAFQSAIIQFLKFAQHGFY